MNDILAEQAKVYGFTFEKSIGKMFPVNRGSVRIGYICATPVGWFALARGATTPSGVGDSMFALKHLANAAPPR